MSAIVEHRNEPAANAAATAAIDAIEDEQGRPLTVVPSDRRIVVRGWALDARAHAFAAVEVVVGGARASGPSALVRPDVAAVYGSPDTVGFRIELALDDAVPGRHAVALQGVRDDGSRVPIPVTASLDVVAPLGRLPAGVTAGAVAGSVDELFVEAGEHAHVRGPLAVPADGVVVMRGWAATPDGVPATLVYGELDGQHLVRGMIGYPRPDVAVHFGTTGASYGFSVRVPAAELDRGEHTLRVRAVAGTSAGYVGDDARIVVGPPPGPQVFAAKARMRGHIDIIGRLDAGSSLLEERWPLRLKANERAVITGWAGDPIASLIPTRVMLVVDGVAHGPVQRGLDRPDVVAATACERLRSSGFSAVVRAEGLGTGVHRAELVALYEAEPVIFDAFSFEVVT